MKKSIGILMALLVAVTAIFAAGCTSSFVWEENETLNEDVYNNYENSTEEPKETAVNPEGIKGLHHAEINIRDYGTVKVELDADTAPITVANFVKLVNDGFYDGLTFHRIINGFMIQGGDPKANGTGGSDDKIKGEFSENGVENNIKHEKGVISMARAKDFDSASSQFFIMLEKVERLDGQYAAFGHVTEGMDIVQKIADDAVPADGNGFVEYDQQPVITSIKMID